LVRQNGCRIVVWARVLPEARAAIERIGAFVQSKM
jgi:hypothetical protein